MDEYAEQLQQEMSYFAAMCKEVADAADTLQDEALDDPINKLEDMAYLLGVGIDLRVALEAIEQIKEFIEFTVVGDE